MSFRMWYFASMYAAAALAPAAIAAPANGNLVVSGMGLAKDVSEFHPCTYRKPFLPCAFDCINESLYMNNLETRCQGEYTYTRCSIHGSG